MTPGHGDVLLAEGDPEVAEDEERLIEEFRRQLDLGLWAAVPTARRGRREAVMVRDFAEVPRDAEQVVFYPGRGRVSVHRVERRARELLRTTLAEEEFAAYERLGFFSVPGRGDPASGYAYLVYPHRPWSRTRRSPAGCSRSTAFAFATTACGCPTPTTCSPSGWRCTGASAS